MSYGEAKGELKLGDLGGASEEVIENMQEAIFLGSDPSKDRPFPLDRKGVKTLIDEYLAQMRDRGFEMVEVSEVVQEPSTMEEEDRVLRDAIEREDARSQSAPGQEETPRRAT